MSSLKAEVAKVKIGFLEIEGLMCESKNYYIAITQLVALNLMPPGRSAKQLESLLGLGFQSHIVQFKTTIHPKAVNAIPLIYFEEVLFNLALKGVEAAINLSRQLIGASLTKAFSIAFKQKFEDDEFQAYFEARQAGIKTRRNLTNAIDDWYLQNRSEKAPWTIYASATNMIYKKLYGMTAEELEQHLGCKRNKSRSVMDKEGLIVIDRAEAKVMELIDYEGSHPIKAVGTARIYPAKSLPFKREDLN